jgi:hypothetical protein
MKRLSLIGASLIFSAAFAAGAARADEKTVTGQLRDSFCYMRVGAHGPSHHKCAMGCVKAGIPAALEEDGTGKIYVLLPPKDKQGTPAGVIERMEQPVTISGHEYSKGGVTYLTVESVK